MATTTMQSAAVPQPQPATRSRPIAQAGPDHPDPMAMTVAEMEAAIAALPGKRDALREAFDRLAACSPSPLPFVWEDLDGHISSRQSSIALRFRQLRVLEAAGAAPAAASLGGTRGDGKGENQELEELEEEEEVEVEVEVEEEEKADEATQEADSDKICNDEKDVKEAREVEVEEEVAELEKKADEEMQEANSDKICNDEKDGKEAREVEVEEEVAELEKKADEEMQEANYDKICNDEKDGKEAREEVVAEEEVEEAASFKIGNEINDEKEAREEEQASKVNEQDPDKDMQVVGKEELNIKDAYKASQDKEEEDQATNMDETVAKMASSVQHKEEEACDKKQEKEAQEQDLHEKVEGAKNAMDQEAVITNEMSSDQGNRALPCRSDDCTVLCANMDAQSLVKLICSNTEINSKFHAAFRCAPDAAALVLHVVELFLHNKIFVKTNKVWANYVGLVQMVPAVVTKPSADTIEQAKRVAKDWKEMIDNPESCKVLGSSASWGLLYFLVSYNIVTEFGTKEIFYLFGNIPCKLKKKSAMLLKSLGLGNRIPELMDYLIGDGQQMDVFWLARSFNMVNKYPPLSLLKGYVEKAKQTAMEISQKNMTHQLRAVIVNELHNLSRAHGLVNKKGIINSNLCTSIREEINILIGELEKKKRSLADPLTASTSNSQQQQTKSKKELKIEQKQEHHKGQENQMRGQLSELAEKLEKKQRKPQQEQQQKQEDKPEEKQQKQEDELEEKKQKQEDKPEEKKRKQEDKPEEKQQKKKQKQEDKREEKKQKQEDKPEEKQQQKKQKHQKKLRQRTHQPPTQGYPAMWNAALRGDLEHPPYAAMHGVHHGYPAQPGWSGVHCASPFMPQLGAPEYIGPFTPLYPRPQFYPR